MGVARLSFGGACRGICRGGTACEFVIIAGFRGRALGEGGIARPSLGVRAPPLFLLPGIGGLNKGAGEAMSNVVAVSGRRGEEPARRGGVDGGGGVSSATTGRGRRDTPEQI